MLSEKEANLVIAYPGYPSNIKLDINDIRDRFYSSACRDLKQNFKITDNFQIARYMMGICNKPKVDNTYFVGNCFSKGWAPIRTKATGNPVPSKIVLVERVVETETSFTFLRYSGFRPSITFLMPGWRSG